MFISSPQTLFPLTSVRVLHKKGLQYLQDSVTPTQYITRTQKTVPVVTNVTSELELKKFLSLLP